MPNVFGFNDEEVKLLLVAVRHMRRTFSQVQAAKKDSSLSPYAERYDQLLAKLVDMAGPLPPEVLDTLR
jgi:hypothetical protein